jgi:hypothetical protein
VSLHAFLLERCYIVTASVAEYLTNSPCLQPALQKLYQQQLLPRS